MRYSRATAFVGGVVVTAVIGGGTAFAGTGGLFQLGHANTATLTTSLTNTHKVPLALKAKSGKPALSVNTRVVVPNLDAELLGGHTAADFLPAHGTAADSSLLGGKPASAFLPAAGTAADASKLGGQPASAFLAAAGTAADADKLGGQPAANYVGTVYAAQTDSQEADPPLLLHNSPSFDHISLPAGSYHFSATADLVNTSAVPGEFGCQLVLSGKNSSFDGHYGNVSMNPAAATGITYAAAAIDQVITTSVPTTAFLSCYTNAGDPDNKASIYDSSLTATRIQDLHGAVPVFAGP